MSDPFALGSVKVPRDEVLRYVVQWLEGVSRRVAVPADVVLHRLVPLAMREDASHCVVSRLSRESFVRAVHSV